jgi:hypothetical protein
MTRWQTVYTSRAARRRARWEWIDDHMLMMATILMILAWVVVIALPIYI